MESLPTIEEILMRNREYAANKFEARPRLSVSLPQDSEPKWSQILIIACLDGRCDPFKVLGIDGSEACIIRNASGRFLSASADIPGLDCLLNLTQIIILQHTDCASTFVTKDRVIDDIRAKRPDASEDQLQQVRARLSVRIDNEKALVADLQAVRECKFLRKELADSAVGLYLDVDTGLVKQVEA